MTLEQALQRIEQLEAFCKSLQSASTIPFQVDAAFRARFLANQQIIKKSSKSASSENISAVTSINFVASTYGTNSVLDNPDEFIEVKLTDGTTAYIPAFTS